MQFIHQPASADRIGDCLTDNLEGSWTHFRAAVAFARASGTRHLKASLAAFARRAHVELIVGIDVRGTSFEALQDLMNAVAPHDVIVFHNRLAFTFHPKLYLFKSPIAADIIVGSGNLTEGGLFTNYEAAVRLRLDLSKSRDRATLASVEGILDHWADPQANTSRVLDKELLARLVMLDLVPLEACEVEQSRDPEARSAGQPQSELFVPFAARPEPAAPQIPGDRRASTKSLVTPLRETPLSDVSIALPSSATGFLMTLRQTDVGSGQTTPGTSRRSPEIFIPLKARNAHPIFWGWPDLFQSDPAQPAKRDRKNVPMLLGETIINVNMMYWPAKSDFRLRSEALRAASDVGDILRIEKVYTPINHEYRVDIVKQDTIQHTICEMLCTEPVPNSTKRFGYY